MASRRARRRQPRTRPEPGAVRAVLDGYAALAGAVLAHVGGGFLAGALFWHRRLRCYAVLRTDGMGCQCGFVNLSNDGFSDFQRGAPAEA